MTPEASVDATRAHAARFAARFPAGAFRPLGRTGLTVSALAFGACRIDDERDSHLQALKLALSSGVNLACTSGTAFDGGSERAIGRAVSELAASAAIRRDEIVVAVKMGSIEGRSLSRAVEREQAGRGFPEIVRHSESAWHCVHPEFLRSRIRGSCRRLGMERIDAVLLQDPELALLEATRAELGRRLLEAFRFLEARRAEGVVSWYGVASDALLRPGDDASALSIPELVSIAQDAAEGEGRPRGDHGFAVVEVTGNVVETAFARVLDDAASAGTAVLLSRPLTARRGDEVVRVRDWPARAERLTLADAAAAVSELEDEFARTVAPALEAAPGSPELFAWGRELPANAGRITGALHWRHVETEMVRPRLEHAIAHVGLHLVGRVRNDWSAWVPRYREAVERLLGAMADLHREEAQSQADEIRASSKLGSGDIARSAIGALLAWPGVTSVAVGMREEGWVREALAALEHPPEDLGGAMRPRI